MQDVAAAHASSRVLFSTIFQYLDFIFISTISIFISTLSPYFIYFISKVAGSEVDRRLVVVVLLNTKIKHHALREHLRFRSKETNWCPLSWRGFRSIHGLLRRTVKERCNWRMAHKSRNDKRRNACLSWSFSNFRRKRKPGIMSKYENRSNSGG